MRFKFRKIAAFLVAALASANVLATAVFADETYDVYNYDRWGEPIPSQCGYIADRAVMGSDLGTTQFSDPSDLFKDHNNNFYIADTGNHRIVEINTDFTKCTDVFDKLTISDEYYEQVRYEYSFAMARFYVSIGLLDSECQSILCEATGLSSVEGGLLNTAQLDDAAEAVMDRPEFVPPDSLTSTTFKSPKGVYISPEDDMIYVADADNSRVVKFNRDKEIKQIFFTPFTEVYGKETTFWPQKVLVDKAGYVYVVVTSTTLGAVTFDKDGQFTSFFGANRVDVTVGVRIKYLWNLIATEDQRTATAKTVAAGITNFDLDDEGFIFTVTESANQDTDKVKKLNPAGQNIFNNNAMADAIFGDIEPVWSDSGAKLQTMLNDIDISDDASLNCLDLTTGRVFQYDKETRLLFIFGGTGNQLGTFQQVAAVETHGQNVYVLDRAKLSVTIFVESVFGELVHEATTLYNNGEYELAIAPWTEVLKRDGNYLRAHVGLSKAYYNKGDYDLAMKYAESAGSSSLYNNGFEGWRTVFLKQYLTGFIIALLIFLILLKVFFVLLRKGIIHLPKLRKNKKGAD